MSKKRKASFSKRGFTFVEAMIVVALFAIVSVAVFSSFAMGMRAWKRITGDVFSGRKASIGLEKMAKDLRRTFFCPAIGFFGEPQQMAFVSVVDEKILNVSYEFLPEEGAVYRNAFSVRQIMAEEEEPVAQRVMFGVKDFVLSYYGMNATEGNFTFCEDWSFGGSLPRAVRVSAILVDGKVYEKTIIIPVVR